MDDEHIIKMYNDGYSMDHISKVFHKYKNRNQKPIVANGVTLIPVKLFTMSDCKLCVYKIIYNYLLHKDAYDSQNVF